MARITEESIIKVRDADVLQVISSYPVKLKKAGANYVGSCPFHNEKSASFTVSGAKRIFKCFGCGKSGDAITFVELIDNVAFIEAVEKVAQITGIGLDYEEETEKQVKDRVERKDLQAAIDEANKMFQWFYWNTEVAKEYVGTRGYDAFVAAEWGIGWSPNDWKTISGKFKENGLTIAAVKAGVLKENAGNAPFCLFKGRVMFPICNRQGQVVSFGGRIVPGVDYGEKEQAKYINGPETALYVKSRVLYGLHKAVKKIAELGWGALTEGNTDVISMHVAGCSNTIGTCGTALTPEHVRLMKRESNVWVLMRDGDAAGTKALLRDIPMLLSAQMDARVFQMPKSEDPDSYSKKWVSENADASFPDHVKGESVDAVEWFCRHKMQESGDKHKKNAALGEICELIAYIDNEFLRGEYIKEAASICGLKKAELEKLVKAKAKVVEVLMGESEDEGDSKFPEWASDKKDEAMEWGFIERQDAKHIGYYFMGESQSLRQMTYYVLTPLYHIYSTLQEENRRMFEVSNGRDKMIVEIPSKNTMSVEQFGSALISEGVFVPDGGYSKIQHAMLMRKLLPLMPKTSELTSLGWQHEEGFWAFANKVYVPSDDNNKQGSFHSYNEFGVVEINGAHFYSPGASKATLALRKSDNIYENDMYLTYKESPINFEEWCQLMVATYELHGWMAISFVLATIFRDIVIEKVPIPFLYAYGIINSGKSQYGESVSNFFFSGLDSQGELYKPFNLNQGTVPSFFDRAGRFSNCPNVLNEFDENFIEEDFFRGIKGFYDGEGRNKMRRDKNKSFTQKVSSTTVLMGQYLSTKDENSVLSRSIPKAFRAVAQADRDPNQLAAYTKLKHLERKGINGILIEILNKRAHFKSNFPAIYERIVKSIQDELKAEEILPQPRILKNIAQMAAIVETFKNVFKFPFTSEEFYGHAKQTVREFHTVVNKTSGVSEFWSMVEYLLDRGEIKEGFDFLVEDEVTSVKIITEGGKPEDKSFTAAKNLLYIRIGGVHKLYQAETRKGTGRVALNEQTLLLYLKEQRYYIGWMKAKKFKSGANSCFVFAYDELNVNLKRVFDTDRKEVLIVATVVKPPESTPADGVWKFVVKETVQTPGAAGTTQTNHYTYNCFTKDVGCLAEVTTGWKIQVKGFLGIETHGFGETRTLDATAFECVQMGTMFQKSFTAEIGPPAGTVDELPF